jgi:DNA-directed RNA polymerase subunit K
MRLTALGENLIWPRDRLTRFEVARLIGARALQIALGAPVLVKTEKVEPIEIAKLEFKEILIPMTIKRRLPSGEEMFIDIKAAIKNWLEEHKGEI